MAGNPFRSRNVPSSVSNEFKARGDGSKLLKWTSQRVPWIYLLSCATGECSSKYDELGIDPTVASPGTALRLFGDNPSLAAYEKGTNLPLPHVESMDVKAMGSLGTTRKASVKIKAYSDEQLIELQKCFFVPGMDVRVQWGWNKSCDGQTPPPLLKEKAIFPAEAICKINKLRKKYPNYDGFQGIVSNFKYSLNKDNAWECEVEIISAADPFTSSKVDNSGCPCARQVETDQGEAVKDFGPIYAALADIYNDGAGAARRLMDTLRSSHSNTSYHAYSAWEIEGVERTEDGGEKEGGWFDSWFFGEETIEYWISFGAFIDAINAMSVPSDGKNWPFGKVSVDDVLLPKPVWCLSADPRVCYIDGGDLPMSYVANENEYGRSSFNAVVTDPGTGKDMVELGSIMCNVIFLIKQYKQVYNGDGSLKTLVDNVLREINRVCGSPWNFVTIATESECGDYTVTGEPKDPDKIPEGPTITILDEKQAQLASQPFNVPSTVGDSTLRDFGLAMKMTGAMKTQALYSGNSQKTRGGAGKDGSGCTGTAVRPFYSGNKVENAAKPSPGKASVSCNECGKGSKSASPPSFGELKGDMEDEINDQTVGAMQEFVNRKVAGETSPEQCAGVPLPFDFNIKVDGIGGFEFGQMITSNRIPPAIRNSFRWQITKVEHSIKPNDWETSISTVCRTNPFGTDEQPPRAN